ncbi:MAG: hypothetical protein ABIH47_00130 [Candidatus Omnitrophota bacterium]
MPKYIDFVKDNSDNSWSVVNKKSGLELGVIEWYNRRYVMFFGDNLILDNICLKELCQFMESLNGK